MTGSMYFRDHLACGHNVLVEVLRPIDPVVRCTRDIGYFSFCGDCETPTGSPAIREIIRTDHVLAPGVWVDAANQLHLDLTVMCESAGYEPTAENKATLIEAARQAFPATHVEVLP